MTDQDQAHLGYWGIRGYGQYIRLTLEASGAHYKESRYTNFEDWFKRDKPASPLLLPNLPYFIKGDVKLSEHDSIIR